MTDITLPPTAKSQDLKMGSLLRGTGRAIASTYRSGAAMFIAAPAIVAIAVIPEFGQHAAEIQIGMFESRETFRALANDSLRWTFGNAKVAGVIIASLATVRFLALGSLRRALLIGRMTSLRLVFALALTFAAELPLGWLREVSASLLIDVALIGVSIVLQAGLLVYVVGILVEDGANSLRRAFTERWPTAILMTFLAAIAFLPAQALHFGNHLVAMGQHPLLLWPIMVFDSLVVGLIATLVGAALHTAYQAGSACGWLPHATRRTSMTAGSGN
jgi:hypothetical protein